MKIRIGEERQPVYPTVESLKPKKGYGVFLIVAETIKIFLLAAILYELYLSNCMMFD